MFRVPVLTTEHLLKTGRHGLKFEAGMAFADFAGAHSRQPPPSHATWPDMDV